MKQLLIRLMITLGLVSFVVSVGLVQAADKSTTSTQTTAVKEKSPLEVINSATEKSTITFQKKYFYDSKGKQDPMLMPWKYINESGGAAGTGDKGVAEGGLTLPDEIDKQLSGIVWSEHDPLALIGDRIVREGDEIAHAKILKINKGE
ncbi:MAG: hypothetical protein ACE14V_16215, partial [bacterium]